MSLSMTRHHKLSFSNPYKELMRFHIISPSITKFLSFADNHSQLSSLTLTTKSISKIIEDFQENFKEYYMNFIFKYSKLTFLVRMLKSYKQKINSFMKFSEEIQEFNILINSSEQNGIVIFKIIS